jgi:hypothetical protein
LRAAGGGIVRVQGEYGYDMLAGFEDRQPSSEGRLFPRCWPWSQACLPWGGFIGMALIVSDRA